MWQDKSVSFPQINLTKDKQSSKLLSDIKDDLNKLRDVFCSCIGKQYHKNFSHLQIDLQHQFNANQFPTAFFFLMELDYTLLAFKQKRNIQNIPEEKHVGWVCITQLSTLTVQCWCIETSKTDEQNKQPLNRPTYLWKCCNSGSIVDYNNSRSIKGLNLKDKI